ncbi:ywbO, partial [Mucuna pruriens]
MIIQLLNLLSLLSVYPSRYSRIMSGTSEKKLVRIDVSSDTVCPWCFVGKRNLDKAIASSKDKYNFEIIWHPFQLNPDAPKEGIDKREYYRRKFGSQSERMEARMSEVFKNIGLECSLSGLMGNTIDSHRLIYYARQQGLDKQHDLVEELAIGYFTQGKYIGDHKFLLESAAKVGLEGAEEFLRDPNNGLKEVEEELKTYSGNITGVPYYVINGNHKLSGGQPPEVFLRAFQLLNLVPLLSVYPSRYSRIMSGTSEKKLVRIDVSSDTVCPWCFVGKRNLDKAIATSKDKYNFEIIWHPFQLDPDAPKEGIDKREYYRRKFGSQSERMEARMSEVFKNVGLEYSLSGLTGNTIDSHRLIYFAKQQGLDKQHDLVEELAIGYFTQGKYIGDHKFLLESAAKVGIEGAEEFLQDPNNGLKEVEEELKTIAGNISGVPYYVINGNHKLSGGQPPEVFLRAFQ